MNYKRKVRHVLELKQRLISIGMLVDHEYRTTLNQSTLKISKGNMHIGHGIKYNNLYPLTVIGQERCLNVAKMPTHDFGTDA